jgi:histidine kinase
LSNALIHTPEGGNVSVAVARDDRFARVDVSDSGIGIDPAQLPYLFERFYRADRSRARTSGGSGIGLTISRHLAWAMGGELTAASAGTGQGSTFSLFLPLV